VQARRQHPRQQVAAHEPTQHGKEAHPQTGGEVRTTNAVGAARPAEFVGAKDLCLRRFRFEGVHREWRQIQPAEEVMHHGVADQHDVFQPVSGNAGVGQQVLDQPPDLFANQPDEFRLNASVHRRLDAAHDVGPVSRLGVQRCPHRQNSARLQIQQLGRQRGGSEIDRHAKAFPRGDVERCVVGEDRGFPLGQIQHQIPQHMRLARKSPPLGQFIRGEQPGVVGGHRQLAGYDLDPASTAPTSPAARKLDALVEEHVLEWAPGHDPHVATVRLQRDENVRLRGMVLVHTGPGFSAPTMEPS
jgi:hypothetical protein